MTIRITPMEAAEIIASHITKMLSQEVTAGNVQFIEEYLDKSGAGVASLSYIEVSFK